MAAKTNYFRRVRIERRRVIEQMKSVPCRDCAKGFPYYAMEFHHRDHETKNFQISSSLIKTPWDKILVEVAKCDVLCKCCHRLRSWKERPKKEQRYRSSRHLIEQLKSVPCKDCGKCYHYSQMDFDHVKGDKIDQVPMMGSLDAIRTEAAKCEVVCANCHAERTQRSERRTERVNPDAVDLVWKRKSNKNPQTLVNDRPCTQPWHRLVGTMSDTDVAKIGQLSGVCVGIYRRKSGIPKYQNPKTWHMLLGTMSDRRVAQIANLTQSTIREARQKRGVLSYQERKRLNV